MGANNSAIASTQSLTTTSSTSSATQERASNANTAHLSSQSNSSLRTRLIANAISTKSLILNSLNKQNQSKKPLVNVPLIDGGFTLSQGIIYPNEELAHDEQERVGGLVMERRLSPFYYQADLEDNGAGGGSMLSSTTPDRSAECPICFMNYPKNMNWTRCCEQEICTECFVHIKRYLLLHFFTIEQSFHSQWREPAYFFHSNTSSIIAFNSFRLLRPENTFEPATCPPAERCCEQTFPSDSKMCWRLFGRHWALWAWPAQARPRDGIIRKEIVPPKRDTLHHSYLSDPVAPDGAVPTIATLLFL